MDTHGLSLIRTAVEILALEKNPTKRLELTEEFRGFTDTADAHGLSIVRAAVEKLALETNPLRRLELAERIRVCTEDWETKQRGWGETSLDAPSPSAQDLEKIKSIKDKWPESLTRSSFSASGAATTALMPPAVQNLETASIGANAEDTVPFESTVDENTNMEISRASQEDLAMRQRLATLHTPIGPHPALRGEELAMGVSTNEDVVTIEVAITALLNSRTKGEGSASNDTVDGDGVDDVLNDLSAMETSATTSTYTPDATPKWKSTHGEERTAGVAQASSKAPTTTSPTKKAKAPVKKQKLPKRQAANASGVTRGRMASRGRGRGTSQRLSATTSSRTKSRPRPLAESSIETSADSGSVPVEMQETPVGERPVDAAEEQGDTSKGSETPEVIKPPAKKRSAATATKGKGKRDNEKAPEDIVCNVCETPMCPVCVKRWKKGGDLGPYCLSCAILLHNSGYDHKEQRAQRPGCVHCRKMEDYEDGKEKRLSKAKQQEQLNRFMNELPGVFDHYRNIAAGVEPEES